MIVYSKFRVCDVFDAVRKVGDSGKAVLPDGSTFRAGSHRIQLFMQKGVSCVTCGVVGNIFHLETHREDVVPHLNLYAVDDFTGKHILMTKDHIIPKSRGGANSIENYQTMCTLCNCKKSNKMPDQI